MNYFKVLALGFGAAYWTTPEAFAVLIPPPTVPFSEAQAYAECSSDVGYPRPPVSGPYGASDHQMGISNSDEFSDASVGAGAAFYVNSVGAGVSVYGPTRRVSAGPTQVTTSYELSWTDGIGSGDIVPTISEFPTGQRFSSFPFVYGTTYTITSQLTGSALAVLVNAARGWGSSLWSDNFTFLGQPDGTPGTATFGVFFSGGVETRTNDIAPNVLTSADLFVSAALGVGDLPPGTRIVTASGAVVPGLPDGGPTLALMSAAVAGILVGRRSGRRNGRTDMLFRHYRELVTKDDAKTFRKSHLEELNTA